MAEHLTRFADDERTMPVVWHQTLLCFVRRCKSEVRAAGRDAFSRLCAARQHCQVTPKAQQELDHSAARGGGEWQAHAGDPAGLAFL
ncbi:hypothetical protein MNEG_16513, partial [Monoraphidium neglectum]